MFTRLLVVSALATGLIAACSDITEDDPGEGGCTPACGAGQKCEAGRCVSAGGGAGDGGTIIFNNADGGGQQQEYDAGLNACAADKTKAQQSPLDLYIMLDQSGSMDAETTGTQTRWSEVTAALKAFVSNSNLTNVAVGIQYFGKQLEYGQCVVRYCNRDSDCGWGCGPCDMGYCSGLYNEDSCEAGDYSTPDVEIAPLPGNAQAIINSINAHSPLTLTPTSAALQGAIDHARSWAQSHPDHVVVDILATDGEPTECYTEMSVINGIAASGVTGTPKVLTFVIGVGESLTNLNGIAAAGGTGSAFLVDTTADVNAQFLAALDKIRGAALGCTYRIPTPQSGTVDFTKINVQYTPGSTGVPQILPQVTSQANCPANGDAWFYDNPAAPTQIVLCNATCNKVKVDATGQVDVLVGCQTVLN